MYNMYICIIYTSVLKLEDDYINKEHCGNPEPWIIDTSEWPDDGSDGMSENSDYYKQQKSEVLQNCSPWSLILHDLFISASIELI